MGDEIATRKPAPPQYAVTTRTPTYANGVFGSKPLLYNDLVKKCKKFFLATCDCGIYLVGERFGIVHTNHNSAVFAALEVDLQRLLATSPRHISLISGANVRSRDHQARQTGAGDAQSESLPPALTERLRTNYLSAWHGQAAVKTPERLVLG